MSMNLPNMSNPNEPELPDAAPEDTDDIPSEEPLVNSGLIAFFIGVFGMLAGFCGLVSVIEGRENILFDIGGILMSLAAFLAIKTLRTGSRRGRTESIFILTLTFLPIFSYVSSCLSRIGNIL